MRHRRVPRERRELHSVQGAADPLPRSHRSLGLEIENCFACQIKAFVIQRLNHAKRIGPPMKVLVVGNPESSPGLREVIRLSREAGNEVHLLSYEEAGIPPPLPKIDFKEV